MDTLTDRISRERRLVLDDLNLTMLFVDAAEIEIPDQDDTDRRLIVGIRAAGRSPTALALLLCRFLHLRRIPSIEIERAHDHVRLRGRYLLPSSDWDLVVTARPS